MGSKTEKYCSVLVGVVDATSSSVTSINVKTTGFKLEASNARIK